MLVFQRKNREFPLNDKGNSRIFSVKSYGLLNMGLKNVHGAQQVE